MDKDGNQALHFACEAGRTLTVRALIDCNANVSAVNNDGQTCLHKAASSQRDCPDLCRLLIGNKAKVNAADGNGDSPLHVALQKGNMKTAEVLLENGANCKVLNGCGETVLHLLCKGSADSHELCEDLISRGVSPHRADREGNLPLHIALKNKLPKTFCWLFKNYGFSTSYALEKRIVQNIDSTHLLCFAVNSCDTECCQKLLDLGVNPNAPYTISELPEWNLHDATSIHPLHCAVAKNNSDLCRILLDHGANVNVQVHTCYITSMLHLAQPLHLAVQLGFMDVCRLLIERGALINAETEKGKTPLYLAIVENRDDIARLLLSHGAIAANIKLAGAAEGELTRLESLLLASREQNALVFLPIAYIVLFIEVFPDEIVSQGKTALHIYLSSCSEGTAVTVFLRVDVVGRDGAGKTSLTKSLTLQEFDPDELSTRGVVLDTMCQIIVKEARDWTTPVTSEHYKDLYHKNVTAIVAGKLNTPEMKDWYFRSKEAALQQDDHQHNQNTIDKGKRKVSRTTQAAIPPSAASDTTLSLNVEAKTDTTAKIPENVKARVSKFLRNKESLEKAQKEMVVTVVDYAGQHVFYATHHLCLTKAGFYYVVFDASQPLGGKTPSFFRVRKGDIVRIPLFDDETNFDRLFEWMSAIHIMEPDHSHRIMLFDEVGIASPAMFLVGTHADRLSEQPHLLERQDEFMRKKLEGTVLAKHIIWASKDKNRMCFYVDNTLTDP